MLDRHYSEIVELMPPDLRSGLQSIAVDGIARHFYEINQRQSWDVSADFPCVLPCYPAVWMEYDVPVAPSNPMWAAYLNYGMRSVGALSWAARIEGDEEAQREALRQDIAQEDAFAFLDVLGLPFDHPKPDKRHLRNRQRSIALALSHNWLPRFVAYWSLSASMGAGSDLRLIFYILTYLSETGSILPNLFVAVNMDDELGYELGMVSLLPFLYAAALIHQDDFRVPEGCPVVWNETITRIPPPDGDDGPHHNGSRQPLHARRGYFRQHTARDGTTRLIWHAPGLAGSAANGAIVKDFALRPATPAPLGAPHVV